MAHVPRVSRSRPSHARRYRPSHSVDAVPDALSGDTAYAERWAKDGVIEPGGVLPGTLLGASIADGTLSITPFADGIRPVAIVDVLPTLPDTDYPEFSYAVLTSDERLYKNIGDVWVLGVNGADIVADSITAGQIAAGGVSASEIAAGAITVGKFRDPISSNLVPNPSFELDGDTLAGDPISGWSLDAGDETQIQTTATVFNSGLYGLRLLQKVTPEAVRITTDRLPVEASKSYRLLAMVRGIAGNSVTAQGALRVSWYDALGVFISLQTSSSTVGVSAVFAQMNAFRTSPANAAYATIQLENTALSGAGDAVFFDDVEFYRADNDLNKAGGNVLIDETGITINNGALIIQDEFGSTVAEAGGFTGGWEDFVRNGLYNGNMANGTTGTLTLGRTADLPYWTTARITGLPNAAGLSGGGIQVTFNAVNNVYEIRSDKVPVVGGVWYDLSIVGQFDVTGAGPYNMRFDTHVQWLTSAGTIISTLPIGTYTTSVDEARQVYRFANNAAPANATHAKVIIQCEELTNHNAANFIRVYSASWLPSVPQFIEIDAIELTGYLDALGNVNGATVTSSGDITATDNFNGDALVMPEIGAPAAPAANHGILYIRDNGAGKTQLVVRFPTGVVQIIATEP